MTFGDLRSWVWCEDCLEWKDADEVSFVGIREDTYGKDLLRFSCDKCGQESKSKVIIKETQPKSR